MKTDLELYRVVMGGSGDSQEEMIIFHDKHTLHHNICISNNNNLNKFLVGIFTRQGHINQVY